MNTDYFNQRSERLLFRKLVRKDIPYWEPFFKNNPSIDYLGIDVSKPSDELASEWIERQLERYQESGMGHLAVEEIQTGKFIGMAGILTRELNGVNEFEIGYSLFTHYWGKGYGTEMAKQLKSYGLQNSVTKTFISIIHTANASSQKVALKNGMTIDAETVYQGMPVFIFRG